MLRPLSRSSGPYENSSELTEHRATAWTGDVATRRVGSRRASWSRVSAWKGVGSRCGDELLWHPAIAVLEAVEAALKFARVSTGKSRIISFTGGFHGLFNFHGPVEHTVTRVKMKMTEVLFAHKMQLSELRRGWKSLSYSFS